eukprot:CAMPEP_0174239496 /NCGR_PEP_ID=MMETSP0417-20130205/14969_1 /TAXON_ID=242541 /ORGANISM="Mayorella sp, Strain BSH-02190019" /LENGTH=143 /DNA_ID=CAMNT_0015318443 /DNA_START=136 /DNA_END=564 /DNA_ORIENTATION=-
MFRTLITRAAMLRPVGPNTVMSMSKSFSPFYASSTQRWYSTTIPHDITKRTSSRVYVDDDGVRVFSREEVAKHNSKDDCWIIINQKVYNVTPWVEDHPGGRALLVAPGKDVTNYFEEQQHSDYAREHMETFCIGRVDVRRRYL